MANHNGHRIIKAPDVDGIITIDMDADGISTPGSSPANNVLVLVDGAEIKGVRFTLNNGEEPYDPSAEADLNWLSFKPLTGTVAVRHLSNDVSADARIYVTGSQAQQDGLMIEADHIASFLWQPSANRHLLTINIWAPIP